MPEDWVWRRCLGYCEARSQAQRATRATGMRPKGSRCRNPRRCLRASRPRRRAGTGCVVNVLLLPIVPDRRRCWMSPAAQMMSTDDAMSRPTRSASRRQSVRIVKEVDVAGTTCQPADPVPAR